jgi:hypothetical protein
MKLIEKKLKNKINNELSILEYIYKRIFGNIIDIYESYSSYDSYDDYYCEPSSNSKNAHNYIDQQIKNLLDSIDQYDTNTTSIIINKIKEISQNLATKNRINEFSTKSVDINILQKHRDILLIFCLLSGTEKILQNIYIGEITRSTINYVLSILVTEYTDRNIIDKKISYLLYLYFSKNLDLEYLDQIINNNIQPISSIHLLDVKIIQIMTIKNYQVAKTYYKKILFSDNNKIIWILKNIPEFILFITDDKIRVSYFRIIVENKLVDFFSHVKEIKFTVSDTNKMTISSNYDKLMRMINRFITNTVNIKILVKMLVLIETYAKEKNPKTDTVEIIYVLHFIQTIQKKLMNNNGQQYLSAVLNLISNILEAQPNYINWLSDSNIKLYLNQKNICLLKKKKFNSDIINIAIKSSYVIPTKIVCKLYLMNICDDQYFIDYLKCANIKKYLIDILHDIPLSWNIVDLSQYELRKYIDKINMYSNDTLFTKKIITIWTLYNPLAIKHYNKINNLNLELIDLIIKSLIVSIKAVHEHNKIKIFTYFIKNIILANNCNDINDYDAYKNNSILLFMSEYYKELYLNIYADAEIASLVINYYEHFSSKNDSHKFSLKQLMCSLDYFYYSICCDNSTHITSISDLFIDIYILVDAINKYNCGGLTELDIDETWCIPKNINNRIYANQNKLDIVLTSGNLNIIDIPVDKLNLHILDFCCRINYTNENNCVGYKEALSKHIEKFFLSDPVNCKPNQKMINHYILPSRLFNFLSKMTNKINSSIQLDELSVFLPQHIS